MDAMKIAEVLKNIKPCSFESHLFQERFDGEIDAWKSIVISFGFDLAEAGEIDNAEEFLTECGCYERVVR